jgi:hypothetical protein
VANNPVLRTIDLTSTWVPLADEPLVANVSLLLVSTGGFAASDADFMIRQGTAIALAYGQRGELSGVDLNMLEVRSTFHTCGCASSATRAEEGAAWQSSWA